MVPGDWFYDFLYAVHLFRILKAFVNPLAHAGNERPAIGSAPVSYTHLDVYKRQIVYRRSEAEMPARLEEVHHAKEEGIDFRLLEAPIEIVGDEQGNVTGMKNIRMELGEPDASGRRRPVEILSLIHI